MTYDCINGWEDMIDALNLDLNAEGIDADDAREVAALALNRIAELQRIETVARAMLAALKAMHSCHRAFSGSPDWTSLDDDARAACEQAIATAEAAGIKS